MKAFFTFIFVLLKQQSGTGSRILLLGGNRRGLAMRRIGFVNRSAKILNGNSTK